MLVLENVDAERLSSMGAQKTYDIIVAGCGPVGATIANLMGHRGISTLVIEPEREPYDLPRAVHVDHEIVRIFQSAGLAERLVPTFSTPTGSVLFGADGSIIRQFQTNEHGDRLGWAAGYFLYQPGMEKILRAALGTYESVEIAWGYSLESVEQDADGVVAVAVGEGTVQNVSASYLLGCDGGRSTVRREAGIALTDLGFEEPWVVVDALVDGPVSMPEFLNTPADVDMQDVMFIIADPKRPTTVVPGVGRHRRWEFMLQPGEAAEDFADGSKVRELVAPWAGGRPYEIIRSTVYRFHALLAEHWQRDRIFLLGDAAHQTPPFYGQGLCHGIRDAANLAWKLDMVLSGHASTELLLSYQPERYPQVRSVIESSVQTGRYICTLDEKAAKARDAEMSKVAARTPPESVDLIPPLSDGILTRRARRSPPVGTRFIQPPMVDSKGRRKLLDYFTGDGFVLLARDGLAGQAADAWDHWADIGATAFKAVAEAISLLDEMRLQLVQG
jgi:3-(3-hydroxy-phenyl)propionate hydroxylase